MHERAEIRVRTISLTKDRHLYLFRYTPGSEAEVVDELVRLAEDADAPLDWLDAATLSFQLTTHAVSGCAEASSPGEAPVD